MASLLDSFRAVVSALDEASVPFAVRGGLAMSIHARPRATIDIGLLAPADSVPALIEALRPAGFLKRDASPTRLAGGQVAMRWLTGGVPGDAEVLTLDVIEVRPGGPAEAWAGRETVEWEGKRVSLVSRQGLIALKRLRGSARDQAELAALEEP